jgi:hypothetical protein
MVAHRVLSFARTRLVRVSASKNQIANNQRQDRKSLEGVDPPPECPASPRTPINDPKASQEYA